MTRWIVTGAHNGMTYPRIVATSRNQTAWLVDALLKETGPAETWFFVWDRPVGDTDDHPPQWLRIGYDAGFGAALFYDGAVASGDDFAWVTLAAEPVTAAPIHYDRDRPTTFPTDAVLPLAELRAVVLEWVRSGQRPVSARWQPVNSLAWDLSSAGKLLSISP